jgi:hypothetical protein
MKEKEKLERADMLTFKGKIVGLTKVKTTEGMAVKVTIDNGVYLEISSLEDIELFKKLCKMIDLEEKLTITISKE